MESMDVENLNSWISRPDVCRCCLSASGSWDLSATYISESGNKEVYSDMLRTCYGISMTHITPWSPSRMLCSMCLGQLREAFSFRRQVLCSEKHFVDYCSTREFDTAPETKQEPPSPAGSIELEADEDTNILDPCDLIECTETKVEMKDEQNQEEKDCDSDEPIAALIKQAIQAHNKIVADDGNGSTTADAESPYEYPPPSPVKCLSERKRGRLTADIVLRGTTACPFRHRKSWFQCFFCPEEYMEMSELREHTVSIHPDIDTAMKKVKTYPRSLQIDISDLECRYCHQALQDVTELRDHFEEIHDEVIYAECIADFKINGRPYHCHICKQEFHVFRTLTTHINEHYANCVCDVCGKSYINSKRLKVHKRTHESGDFPCSECGKVLRTKIARANHMENAHCKRQLKCQICSKPMKHYNDRVKHMSEVHNITNKFKCHICGKEYNVKHYLATHMRQTHGSKNKKCLECGMAFITNHALKKHMLRHSGEKPHCCSVCGKAYARSYTLKEHMRVHESERLVAE